MNNKIYFSQCFCLLSALIFFTLHSSHDEAIEKAKYATTQNALTYQNGMILIPMPPIHLAVANDSATDDTIKQYFQNLLLDAKKLKEEIDHLLPTIAYLYELIFVKEKNTLKGPLFEQLTLTQKKLQELGAVGVQFSDYGKQSDNTLLIELGVQIAKECTDFQNFLNTITVAFQQQEQHRSGGEMITLPNQMQESKSSSSMDANNTLVAIQESDENEEQAAEKIKTSEKKDNETIATLPTVTSGIKNMNIILKNKFVQSQMKNPLQTTSGRSPVIDIKRTQLRAITTPHHRQQTSHNKIANIHDEPKNCKKKACIISVTMLLAAALIVSIIFTTNN